ncbi:hypothetical protein [Metabacillus halosaccharovorans]|uniref:Swarming motility protein SwrB n=1 Tax=Metabacillus halosaccharovorans TaxID=930124 RepID=A0ABT3DLA8_9BACI|nr:hypothetical protein [Metabacillus halosaccharovorans]MCV9887686.1 hypothetical protein [Metabacillus halosaccharovorans]
MPTTILLLLSLLLHVVAFYFIIVLYMKYSNMKNLSDTQRQILEETENSMTSFLIDMKDENEKLIKTLLRSSNERIPDPMKEEAIELNQNSYSETEQKPKAPNKTELEVNSKELPGHLSGIDDMEDIVEITQTPNKNKPPFEIEAINLYKQGYTVEQIAKRLNKGKTEVELLLKFRQL